MKNLPIIIIGSGGHAKVVLEALKLQSATVLGLTDSSQDKIGETVQGIPILGNDEIIFSHSPSSIRLVNGIGAVGSESKRKAISDSFSHRGYEFATVIHPSSIVSSTARIGNGAQIMAGVVLQPDCLIGENTIISTSASVDHDCIIGEHTYIAPGATIAGGVRIGNCVLVGAGSTILHGMTLADECKVGAGAVVTTPIDFGLTVSGVPARPHTVQEN